jgi:hypothetical protein
MSPVRSRFLRMSRPRQCTRWSRDTYRCRTVAQGVRSKDLDAGPRQCPLHLERYAWWRSSSQSRTADREKLLYGEHVAQAVGPVGIRDVMNKGVDFGAPMHELTNSRIVEYILGGLIAGDWEPGMRGHKRTNTCFVVAQGLARLRRWTAPINLQPPARSTYESADESRLATGTSASRSTTTPKPTSTYPSVL